MKIKSTKILILSFIALFTVFNWNCGKINDFSDSNEENSDTGLIEKTVIIDLPPELVHLKADMKISSLFSETSEIKNDEATVEVINNNFETVFATNVSGQIILLGMNRGDVSDIELSIESTAKTMLMLHPWAIDLSTNAKIEAMQYISTLPEYSDLVASLTTSLSTDSLNPVLMKPLLDKILSLRKDKSSRNLIVYSEPLRIDASAQSVTITNNECSVGYTIGLYNEVNQLIEKKYLSGQDKSFTFFEYFLSGTFDIDPEYPEISFNYSNIGEYTIEARNGMAFDGSSLDINARRENTWILFKKFLSLINKGLGKSADKCAIESTSYLISIEERFSSVIDKLNSGQISKDEATRTFIEILSGQIGDVGNLIDECLLDGKGIKIVALKKLLGFLDVSAKIQSSFDAGAILGDWLYFDNSIDNCFAVNVSGDVETCCYDIADIDVFIETTGHHLGDDEGNEGTSFTKSFEIEKSPDCYSKAIFHLSFYNGVGPNQQNPPVITINGHETRSVVSDLGSPSSNNPCWTGPWGDSSYDYNCSYTFEDENVLDFLLIGSNTFNITNGNYQDDYHFRDVYIELIK